MPVVPDLRIEINEEQPGKLSYMASGFPLLTIESGQSSGYVEFSKPFDYYFLSIDYFAGTGSGAALGDTISSEVDKDRDLTTLAGAGGQLPGGEAAGDDIITVVPAMLTPGLIHVGYHLKFAGSGNPEYQVIEIVDRDAGTIRLDRNLENAYSSGDKIYRTIELGRDIPVMPAADPIVFGESKIGASCLKANWKFRVTYDAADTNGRTIAIAIEGSVKQE